MGKYKYLLKNIGLLTLSNFATKLFSFFLVPLYTSVLTTEQYGTYDLFNTTVGVLVPIFTLNAVEYVLRFSLERNYDRDAVVTIGTKWLTISSIIVLGCLLINNAFNLIPMLRQYAIYFFLMYFVQALSGIVTAYSRGTDHVAALSVSSVIASIFMIGCNIIFLVPLKMGLPGYFLANIIGPLVQCLYLIVRMRVWGNFNLKKHYRHQEKEMLAYSVPMIANSISWWINGVSDRYIVTWLCGVATNGVYSVSNKIPSILNVFQTIFNQAWALSTVKDFDPEDTNGFFANTYKAYNCLMVVICAFIIAFDRILAKFLYANSFYVAWKYVPFLTIAIVFGALTGYLGGFFTAVKDSKAYASSTIVGAVSNIVMNLALVPFMGALGATFATAVSYVEVWAVRLVQSKKYINLKINIVRDVVSYILLVLQTLVLLILPENGMMYSLQALTILLILALYKNDIALLVGKILKK
ncbi:MULTISPECIES: lipopolysaccharide biosynthesis protein [Lactiplantibacillus]|uniref:lipopolysaccharide biosynthesis protein n=1 Tax=Lactiplantibacillus plantarum TaxID=1590 RepID=UPI00311CE063